MTGRSLEKLAHDVSREAVDSMRGYSYQVLRSVRVWIDLSDDEALVLEGAEDIDRLSPGAAVVEQVKDTAGSGSVTLRTRAVLDAIDHAWIHARDNPSVRLTFRYLTTSRIGREQGNPLGLDIAGLTAWGEVREDPASEISRARAIAIATFVSNQSGLSEDLVTFLRSSSPDQAIARIISPIDWITGEGDIEALRRDIEARLKVIGAGRGDSVLDSVRALGELHLEAWRRVVEKDRAPLTRADFLTVFEGATRTAVPNSVLNALVASAIGQTGNEDAFALQLGGLTVERVPPLPPRYYRRASLENELSALISTGTVMVQGGTGMGKTTLVAAVAAVAPNVAWLSLRDTQAALIVARLTALVANLAARVGAPIVVIDDLEPGHDPRMIERALSDLFATVSELGGRIVITGAQDLPPRLAAVVGLLPGGTLRARRFERNEIAAYLAAQGCPSDLHAAWAGFIEIGTSGHPQLVHARIDGLKARGYPRPTSADIIAAPQEVIDVRTEARKLISQLSGDALELLLRASLESGRLSREQLIRIGLIEVPIAAPGAVVDRLMGSWLELADDGDFRVSPLARDAALSINGMDWVRAMHIKLAWAQLQERTITASTVMTLMTHATVGGSMAPLAVLIPNLLAAEPRVWKQIGETCGIFTMVGTGEAEFTIFADPADAILFRMLQFRIAIAADDRRAVEIVDRANSEWACINGDRRVEFFRFLFLSQLLRQETIPFSLAEVIAYGVEFDTLGKRLHDSLPDKLKKTDEGQSGLEGIHDFSSFMVIHLTKAVRTTGDFEDLLGRIEALPRDHGRLVLSAFGGDPVGAGLNSDRLWLHEMRAESPDWQRLRAALERGMALADTLSVPALKATIAPLLVRMIDQDMADAEGAIATGEALRAGIVGTAPLECAIAKVMWRRGDVPPALAIYHDALPRWDTGRENLELVAAYRDAGIAASRVEEWLLAADHFSSALGLLPPGMLTPRRVGLMFDIGHALMMAEEAQASIDALALGVAELEPLEPISLTEPILSMQKRAGAMLQALIERAAGRGDPQLLGILAGVCSSLDPIVWDEMNPTPTDFIVYNLVSLERLTTPLTVVAARYLERLRATRFTVLRALMPSLTMPIMVASGDYSHLMADVVVQARAFAIGRSTLVKKEPFENVCDPDQPFVPFDGIFDAIYAHVVGGIFSMAARGPVDTNALARWIEDVPQGDEWAAVRILANEAHRLFTTDEELWPAVRKPLFAEYEQLLAALAAICRAQLDPNQVLSCHRVWAHYTKEKILHEMIANDVEHLVVSRWLALCEQPALLVTPRLTVPAIRSAAEAGGRGWSRVKAVLLAAIGAVNRQAAQGVRADIEAIEP